jgi:hypothetical protein
MDGCSTGPNAHQEQPPRFGDLVGTHRLFVIAKSGVSVCESGRLDGTGLHGRWIVFYDCRGNPFLGAW